MINKDFFNISKTENEQNYLNFIFSPSLDGANNYIYERNNGPDSSCNADYAINFNT